jgi:hypothetical protein
LFSEERWGHEDTYASRTQILDGNNHTFAAAGDLYLLPALSLAAPNCDCRDHVRVLVVVAAGPEAGRVECCITAAAAPVEWGGEREGAEKKEEERDKLGRMHFCCGG